MKFSFCGKPDSKIANIAFIVLFPLRENMKIEQLNLWSSMTFIIMQTISDFSSCFFFVHVSKKISQNLKKKKVLDFLINVRETSE